MQKATAKTEFSFFGSGYILTDGEAMDTHNASLSRAEFAPAPRVARQKPDIIIQWSVEQERTEITEIFSKILLPLFSLVQIHQSKLNHHPFFGRVYPGRPGGLIVHLRFRGSIKPINICFPLFPLCPLHGEFIEPCV